MKFIFFLLELVSCFCILIVHNYEDFIYPLRSDPAMMGGWQNAVDRESLISLIVISIIGLLISIALGLSYFIKLKIETNQTPLVHRILVILIVLSIIRSLLLGNDFNQLTKISLTAKFCKNQTSELPCYFK
jgi:hypothetical protein